MPETKCPTCGCRVFYIKDPDDEYETYEFDCSSGEIEFAAGDSGTDHPEVEEDTEIYCNRCAWHGDLKECRSR